LTKQTTLKFTAHGKFLITGEYAVLDNVPALAIPLKLNQYLEISSREDDFFSWKSYDEDGSLWFETRLSLDLLFNVKPSKIDDDIAAKLIEILQKAIELHPNAIEIIAHGFDAVATLDFNRKYGMGTSSTLISLIAQWLECDAYELQFACFGGSGYDIACATAGTALVYNYNNAQPAVEFLNWIPAIKQSIFFVYQNRKQNSRDSIAQFNANLITAELRAELSAMPQRFIASSNDLEAFHKTVQRHEAIISSLIGVQPVQEYLFPDYSGVIKSLGGWGGDFMMCTGGKDERNYFKNCGYEVILEWDEVIL